MHKVYIPAQRATGLCIVMPTTCQNIGGSLQKDWGFVGSDPIKQLYVFMNLTHVTQFKHADFN